MAKNMQPVLKRCRTLGVSPAAMGYSKTSNKNPGGQRRAKKSTCRLPISTDIFLVTRLFLGAMKGPCLFILKIWTSCGKICPFG